MKLERYKDKMSPAIGIVLAAVCMWTAYIGYTDDKYLSAGYFVILGTVALFVFMFKPVFEK